MRVYTHPACLQHEPGPAHPEHSGRLAAVIAALRAAFPLQLDWIEAPAASDEQLARAHSRRLIAQLRELSPATGHSRLDEDTLMSPASLDATVHAAGAICAAIDAVMTAQPRRAFCAVRPPGHHSTRDQAMGFCLFNQIAVGARHALAVHSLARLAVVDFDVHHGNGTQSIFAADPRVLFVSSHQSPLYPGTGASSETGVGNVVTRAQRGVGLEESFADCGNSEYCAEVVDWPGEASAFEVELLDRINEYREAGAICGTTPFEPSEPLTMHPSLRCAARVHALDMAARDYVMHTTPEGLGFADRAADAGFDLSVFGETLAAGLPSAEDVAASDCAPQQPAHAVSSSSGRNGC